MTDKKEETKKRLIDAVGKLLSKGGFKGLGVNKVAREAGVDKVLIYRYFNGMPGLVAAFSRTVDFWPGVDELMGTEPEKVKAMPPDAQVAHFFKAYAAALRKRPVTQDILAWELLEKNELSEQLEYIRVRTILEYFDALDRIPDAPVLSSIVILMGGAVNHLIIKSRIYPVVGGIDMRTRKGWKSIEQGIDLLLKGIFSR
ncbi:MAG: TetR/AcrR family transcriptional regulator [Desulfobacterales bacterium]|nr:TetR/AcrR family transcriptional regulator [Desulfobacterales bacterium]